MIAVRPLAAGVLIAVAGIGLSRSDAPRLQRAPAPELCRLIANPVDAFTYVRPPFRRQPSPGFESLGVATEFEVTYIGFDSFPQAQAALRACFLAASAVAVTTAWVTSR